MILSTITSKVEEFLSTGLGGSRVDDANPEFIERRAYARSRVRFEGTVDLDGQRLPVRGIDFHRAGACIAVDHPLPEGARVFFFAKSHGLMGWANVRWGAWNGKKFHVGLEFRSPLMRAEAGDWRFSAGLSANPIGIAHRA